jgi:hypothetical protein
MLQRTLLAVFALAALLFAACERIEPATATESGALAATEPAAAPSPVVHELITSQGCSSCPAADRTLATLGSDPALRGRVIPLAFHVDYWDSIGWKDPFSSEEWTARQYAYARPFKSDGVYTPQLVVNGRTHLNGAEEARIRELIAEMARAPSARVELETSIDGGKLTADARAEVGAALAPKKLVAVVSLYENGATTSVRRGENAGRTLENDYIVRRLASAFEIAPASGARGSGSITFDLDPSWNREKLGVAVFLQDPETLAIYGAAAR